MRVASITAKLRYFNTVSPKVSNNYDIKIMGCDHLFALGWITGLEVFGLACWLASDRDSVPSHLRQVQVSLFLDTNKSTIKVDLFQSGWITGLEPAVSSSTGRRFTN